MASGSSSPTCAPALRSASWQVRRGRSGSAVMAEREQRAPRRTRRCEERPAPTGSVLVTRTSPPAGRRVAAGGVQAAKTASSASRCGAAHGNLEAADRGTGRESRPTRKLSGFGVKVTSVARLDGHGQGEAAVVVGVVADDGDAAGARAVGTTPSLSPRRAGLTATGGPGHASCDGRAQWTAEGIKIIELAGIGPAPVHLHDAGRRRSRGAAPRAGRAGCGRARRRGARRARRRTGTS